MTQFMPTPIYPHVPFNTPFGYAFPQARPFAASDLNDRLKASRRTPGTHLSAHYKSVLKQAEEELAKLDTERDQARSRGRTMFANPACAMYQTPYRKSSIKKPKVSPSCDGVPEQNTGTTVNVNIGNVEHADFNAGSAPATHTTGTSTNKTPFPVVIPPGPTMVPNMQSTAPRAPVPVPVPVPVPTPYGLPFQQAHLQWGSVDTRPKPVNHGSPFSAPSLASQPVLTVQHLLRAGKEITVNLNPSLVAQKDAAAFPLIADMQRLPDFQVWAVKADDKGQKSIERWQGWDEPATLPKLNRLTLISSVVEGEIVIENGTGVTCGDVLRALYDYSQSPLPPQSRPRHPLPRSCYNPFQPSPPPPTKKVDLWYDQTCFKGLRSNEHYVKERLGWPDPTCFVVDFGRSSGWLWR